MTNRLYGESNDLYMNTSTRIFVLILGVLAGFSGILHGFFETLQGSKRPEDILPKIGAFTIIPNFLVTGILAIVIGISVIIWSITNIHKKNGPMIYLLLSIILFFVGGGVALIPGSILIWGVATRIRKPLSWWEKILSIHTRKFLATMWPGALLIGFVLFIIGFCIWLFIVPPCEIREISAMHYICWSFLALGVIFLGITIVCGFARDIKKRTGQ